MTIAFVRGQYINNFELQSYYPMLKEHRNIEMVGIASLRPKHKAKIPTINLISPVDLPDFPKKLPVLNRLTRGDAMYLWGLENTLKSFDIAHVRETYFHFSSQAVYAKRLGNIKKIVTTCSETIPFNHETIWGRKRLKRNVIEKSDHFHCLTQKAKKCLLAEGVEENKITVISYGIDLEKFKPIKKEQLKKNIIGLFVGRLEQQKGIEELLAAYKRIKSEIPNFELQVIGKGPAAVKFENLGIYPGFFSYSKMPKKMVEADFLILPSKASKYWEEYLGMVLLEAMACGTPIVSTNCGAIPEVVGNAGIIVEQGSAEALYKGIKEMVVNKELRNELSMKGLSRVKTYYDATRQSEKLYQLYKKVLSM